MVAVAVPYRKRDTSFDSPCDLFTHPTRISQKSCRGSPVGVLMDKLVSLAVFVAKLNGITIVSLTWMIQLWMVVRQHTKARTSLLVKWLH